MIFRRILFALFLTGIAFTAYMYTVAARDPVVRESEFMAAGWPAGAPPQRILLISDVHVAGPDMPPQRLARIVEQINALEPDLVLFAGDFVSDKSLSTHTYAADDALAPLAKLKARLGVVAVMGNHDHWRDTDFPAHPRIAQALRDLDVDILDNQAARYGPFVVGGVDDDYTGHADLPKTLTAMQALAASSDPAMPPVHVILSHSPDIFPDIAAPASAGRRHAIDAPLVLAGHTHCGQIVLPFAGAIATMSEYGDRYACGRVDEDGKTLIVGAGLGTSILPLRLGAVPDMWMITVIGKKE